VILSEAALLQWIASNQLQSMHSDSCPTLHLQCMFSTVPSSPFTPAHTSMGCQLEHWNTPLRPLQLMLSS